MKQPAWYYFDVWTWTRPNNWHLVWTSGKLAVRSDDYRLDTLLNTKMLGNQQGMSRCFQWNPSTGKWVVVRTIWQYENGVQQDVDWFN